MVFKSLFAAGLLAGAAAAHGLTPTPRDGRVQRCAAPPPTKALLASHKKMAAKEAHARKFKGMSLAAAHDPINVQVYVHVVSADDTAEGGNVSDEAISAQIDKLNETYAPSQISFTLAETDRTVNEQWAVDGDETAMKTQLRKGSYKDLNLYLLNQLNDGALGYCYYPVDTPEEGSDQFIIDGCSILNTSLPGGSPPYDLGITTVHEVGHWFGLLHTFEGGCEGDGDFIDDTPAEAEPAFGCPIDRDTCPDKEGLDPIHNFMDYTDDSCLEEFTAGQTDRMTSQWDQYRANA